MKRLVFSLFVTLALISETAAQGVIVVADSVARPARTNQRVLFQKPNGQLFAMPRIGPAQPIGSGGAVQSVSGKTGNVVLTQSDINGLSTALDERPRQLTSASQFASATQDVVRWDGSDWVKRNGTAPTAGLDGIFRPGPIGTFFERQLYGRPVTPLMFGAVGGAKVVFDAAVTSGSAVVTSATGGFESSLVGQKIMVRGGATGGAPHLSTIASVQSPTQLTMTNAATANASGVECTYGGVDETARFQAALDYLLANGGGELFIPKGRYWIEGTLYVNPAKQIPITLKGVNGNPMLDGWATVSAGTSLMRTAPGDFIRVNLDAAGNGVQPANVQYVGFSIEGIAFVSKSDVAGINGVKTFRTRGNYRNLFASRIDYLIRQPASDTQGNTSYNDQSIFENLRISSSRYSGLLLTYSDASVLNGFYFEGPQPTAKYALEITNSSTVAASGLLHWSDGTHQTIAGGSFIRLNQVWGGTFRGIHMEKVVYETGFDLTNCGGLAFNGLFTNFSSNDMFRVSTVRGLDIRNWYSWETKGVNTFDINFVTGTTNVDVLWDNAVFYDKAFPAGSINRPMQINNLSNRGKITRTVQREDVSDFNTVSGFRWLRSSSGAPANAPTATWTNGFQITLNDDDNFAKQFVENGGFWWKRSRSSGTWGGWTRMHDEQTLGPSSNINITGGSIAGLSKLSLYNTSGMDFVGTGTNTNRFSLFQGNAGGFSNAILKARNADRNMGFVLQPNGAGTTSKINLANSSDTLNYGSLALQTSGAVASLYTQSVGTPTTSVSQLDLGTNFTTLRLTAARNSLMFTSVAGYPTTTDVGSNYGILWKNTTSSQLSWWANDGGTMRAISPIGGTATFSGTGSQMTFTIPHGLGYVPTVFTAEPGSAAAASPFFRTADASNITVTFLTAPASGTNNVVLNWSAR